MKILPFTAAKAANLMWSRFAARTEGRSFRRAGWKMIVSVVFIMAGNMIRRGSVSSSPARMRRFKSKIKIRSYPTEEYLGLIFAFLGDGAAPPLPRYSDLDAGGIVDVLLSEEWPCNYFNRLDNLGDPVHVPFTHRESRSRIGVDVVVPDQLVAEENDVGIKLTRNLPSGKSEARYILMPNMNHLRHPLKIKGLIAKQLGEGSVDRFLVARADRERPLLGPRRRRRAS